MELERPPAIDEVLQDASRLRRALSLETHERVALLTAKYRPWRKVKRIARDIGVDPLEAWCFLTMIRSSNRVQLPLRSAEGRAFRYGVGAAMLEPLHRIDVAVGGGATALDTADGVLADPDNQRRFRIRTLMDEAIESSRIEGAVSTRKNAIELLRSGRAPSTRHERMFVNNYAAMREIKHRLAEPLSVGMLVDLQRILTQGTLNHDDEGGRLRVPGEDVRVVDDRDGSIVFVPPDAMGLERRLEAVCEFANETHVGDRFIHPIVKACILHFMVGYEHPFVDGNGRTARAVFYWAALRQGYRIFEYLTISDIIREGTSKYPQAYLDSELDSGDLTYFILYKLGVIEQSLARLAAHLSHEEAKIKQSEVFIRVSKDLNLRQRLLLSHALRHPKTMYTAKSHATSNGITENTARADLLGLERKRFLTRFMDGKTTMFQLAPGLAAKLAKKAKA